MYKVSVADVMERVADFKSTSERNAYKNYKKWCKKNGLYESEALGEMIKRGV